MAPTEHGFGPGRAGGAGGDVEAENLRIRGQGREVLPPRPGVVVPPVGGVGAIGVPGGRRAGVGAGGLDERLEFCGDGGSARLFELRWGKGPAHAGLMSVRAKSSPLNSRASRVALASA